MNYRHAFHAGNFADVMKHVTLVAVLLHLRKKEKGFRVVDTHAGRGLYNIAAGEALRTGEALDGIGRLREFVPDPAAPMVLATYLQIARSWGPGHYPGSPLIVARLLRAQDHLFAFERQPDEAKVLAETLAGFPNAKSACADGYARLTSLLPPPERRGLVLIDPPYEADDEFAQAARALGVARERFATGIFLLWHPVKLKAEADALLGEARAQGPQDILRLMIDVGGEGSDEVRLSSAALLIVNPPYGLAEEMRSVFSALSPHLGRGAPARMEIEAV